MRNYVAYLLDYRTFVRYSNISDVTHHGEPAARGTKGNNMKTYTHRDGSLMTDELPSAMEGQSKKGIQLPDGRWARIGQTPHRGHPFLGDNSNYFLCQSGPSKLIPTRTETLANVAAKLVTEEAIVAICGA